MSDCKSPPMWGCGLKFQTKTNGVTYCTVTPYVGVWIEIPRWMSSLAMSRRHPLCGGVD